MKTDSNFWEALDALVRDGEIVIDRPKDSQHPRYPDYIYPFDYGYIANTTSTDGAGIDLWQIDGSREVTGAIITFDPVKRDSEIKILLGASEQQARQILECHRRGAMQAILVRKS